MILEERLSDKLMVYEKEERLKEELGVLSTKTIGIYGYMSGIDRTYFDNEYSAKRKMGNRLLKQLQKSENIESLYKMMQSIDELTVHGVQEFHRQHLLIPKFLYVGINELTEMEYGIYIRLLTTYCFDKKQAQISQTSLYWFKLVCLEMYEERIQNKKVYSECYLKKVLLSENKKYF